MPPAFVQNVGEANSKSSSATLVITTGVAAALGNCVLVAVGGLTQSTDIQSCADSRGNTYTRLGGQSYDLGVGRFAIFASILTTALQVSDTITATWASAVSTRVMAAIEVSGITSLTLDGSTPITIEQATPSTSMSNGPTATTTNPDDFLWAAWLVSNATATFDLTPDAGWTESQLATTGQTGTNRSIGTQYRVVSATGAYTATATQDASRAYDGILVALPGATAGTTVTVPSPATATAAGLVSAVSADANITVPSPATATASAPVQSVAVDPVNLLVNPHFDTNVSGWSIQAPGVIAHSTAWSASGAGSLYFTAPTGTGFRGGIYQDVAPVIGGLYSLSATLNKIDTISRGVRIYLLCVGGPSNNTLLADYANYSATGVYGIGVSSTVPVPAGCTSVRFGVDVVNDGATQATEWYLDSASLFLTGMGIAAPTATATAAALVPTVAATTDVVVPSPAAATASALAPSLLVNSTVTVPSPATATAAALVPTVAFGGTITVPAPATASASAGAPTVVIATPPPSPVLPVWRFVLANSIDLSPITELARATSRSVKVALNRPGSASFDLALDAPGASDIVAIKTCVLAYQHDPASSPVWQLRWSGPVWTISEDLAGNKMSVACIGWFELLNHRYLVADSPPNVSTAGVTNGTFESGTSGWAGLTGGTTVATIAQSAVSPHSGSYSLSVSNPNDVLWNVFSTLTGTMENWQIYRLTFWVRAATAYSATFGSPPLYVHLGTFDPTPNAAFLAAWDLSTTWTSYSLEYTHIGGTLTPATSYSNWQSNPSTRFGLRFSFALLPGWPDIYIDDVTLAKVGVYQNGYRYYEDTAADDIAYSLLTTLNEENPSESLPVAIGTSTGAAPPNNNPPRNRTYKRYTNVGQAIKELSDIENGYDFEVNPATRELDLWHQQVGGTGIYGKGEEKPEVRFGYMANPENLVAFSRQIDGQIVSNDTFTLGRFGAGRATDLASISSAGSGLGYRLQDVVSMSDVPNLDILKANAAVETTLRAQPRQTFSFTPKPYAPGVFTLRPFIDYDLGDIVYVSAKRGRVSVSNQAQRVFGIDISIGENGVERVTSISTSPSA
jgi:hypothetical protein